MYLLFGILKSPLGFIFFLWLFSKNKLLTRDNLGIRRKLDNVSCLFCMEAESIHHLFFECVVAKQLWAFMYEVLDKERVGFSLYRNY
jgi:hypothetical protein